MSLRPAPADAPEFDRTIRYSMGREYLDKAVGDRLKAISAFMREEDVTSRY